MPEKDIVRTYPLPGRIILNLLEKIKDALDPPIKRSHTIPAAPKLHFLASGSFHCTVASVVWIPQSTFSPVLLLVLN